jgi:hypothetical protein
MQCKKVNLLRNRRPQSPASIQSRDLTTYKTLCNIDRKTECALIETNKKGECIRLISAPPTFCAASGPGTVTTGKATVLSPTDSSVHVAESTKTTHTFVSDLYEETNSPCENSTSIMFISESTETIKGVMVAHRNAL